MNEKDVLKQSVKVFIGGLIIFSIVGFVLKQISYLRICGQRFIILYYHCNE